MFSVMIEVHVRSSVDDDSRAKRWVGTSWKMTKTTTTTVAYMDALNARSIWPPDVEVFVLPPATALKTARDRLRPETPVRLGGQNAHWANEGAFTGEVSMSMLRDAGASLVEVGHSERRRIFGETDAVVNKKVLAALRAGLQPLVCVGETSDERRSGRTIARVLAQVQGALGGLTETEYQQVIIAYEPVWAIGDHGTPAPPDEVGPVIQAIAREVTCAAILYGGSVDGTNAGKYLAQPGVDGLFVGRFAWDPEGLLFLVDLASRMGTSGRK